MPLFSGNKMKMKIQVTTTFKMHFAYEISVYNLYDDEVFFVIIQIESLSSGRLHPHAEVNAHNDNSFTPTFCQMTFGFQFINSKRR